MIPNLCTNTSSLQVCTTMGLWMWIFNLCCIAGCKAGGYPVLYSPNCFLWSVEWSGVESGMYKVWNVIKFSCSAEPTGIFGLLIFIFQMIHVFRDYGPGVRYIRFRHGGKDTQYWAGWYGIRVTDSSVEICPAVDT